MDLSNGGREDDQDSGVADQEEERLISRFLSWATRWIAASFAQLVKLGKGSDFRRKNMFLFWDVEMLLGHWRRIANEVIEHVGLALEKPGLQTYASPSYIDC